MAVYGSPRSLHAWRLDSNIQPSDLLVHMASRKHWGPLSLRGSCPGPETGSASGRTYANCLHFSMEAVHEIMDSQSIRPCRLAVTTASPGGSVRAQRPGRVFRGRPTSGNET